MNVNEFVKKYGIEHAKHILTDDAPLVMDLSYTDLKSLIEIHELVGNFGGIKRAKRILKKSYMSFNTMVSVVWNDKPFQCTLEQLEQAIADMESCQ